MWAMLLVIFFTCAICSSFSPLGPLKFIMHRVPSAKFSLLITGFETATFSLYDGEMQCSIAGAGREDFTPGSKTERGELNVCSYVLLDTEPLLMEDMLKDPTWQDHPNLAGLDKGPGYAGFPVINSENFALGTLCMMNFSCLLYTSPSPRD